MKRYDDALSDILVVLAIDKAHDKARARKARILREQVLHH